MTGTRIVAKRADESTVIRNRSHFKKFRRPFEYNDDHAFGYNDNENSSEDDSTDDDFECEPNVP